jgi:hypothetical protein
MAQGLSPDLDLTSTFAKLARAEEHFKAVESEISKWVQSSRYEFFVERGTQGTRIGIAVCQVGPPPDLVRWAVIVGDCLTNLRSSLDHLIIAYCKLNSFYVAPAKKKRVTFVIVDSPEKFTEAMAGNLEGATPKLSKILESLQPFNRTHPSLPPLLAIIRDLSNADKHRLLQVAGAGVMQTSGRVLGDTGRGEKAVYINPEPIQNNDVICMVESAEPDPHLAIDTFKAHVEIAIWHKLREGSTNPMDARTPFALLLPLLIDEVKFVLNEFKFAV